MNNKVSNQTKNEALSVAKGIQKQGQSKEQTKLIAAGIEKGIALYKKQHKAKLREQDKNKKKLNKAKESVNEDTLVEQDDNKKSSKLPWILLGVSWLGFVSYFVIG